MTRDWTALIAGDRMALDGEFADRVHASSLSPQQWSLVMTATEFEIESPGTPEDAELVANTDNLPAVAEELERVERMGPTDAGDDGDGSSVLSRIAAAFGSVGGGHERRIEEAEELADEYAGRLQERLVERGRWADVCARAASG